MLDRWRTFFSLGGRLPFAFLIRLFRSRWIPHVRVFILLLIMLVLAWHIVVVFGWVILSCVWVAVSLVLKIVLCAFRQIMKLKRFYPPKAVNHICNWLSSFRFVLLHEQRRLLTLPLTVNSRFLLIYSSWVLLLCNFLLSPNRSVVTDVLGSTYGECSVVNHSVKILQF